MIRKRKTLVIKVPERIFEVKGDLLIPVSLYPQAEDKVKVDLKIRREAKTIYVGQTGRISDKVCMYDTLCFEHGTKQRIFQVMPSETLGVGILRFIKEENVEAHFGSRSSQAIQGRLVCT